MIDFQKSCQIPAPVWLAISSAAAIVGDRTHIYIVPGGGLGFCSQGIYSLATPPSFRVGDRDFSTTDIFGQRIYAGGRSRFLVHGYIWATDICWWAIAISRQRIYLGNGYTLVGDRTAPLPPWSEVGAKHSRTNIIDFSQKILARMLCPYSPCPPCPSPPPLPRGRFNSDRVCLVTGQFH